VKPILIQLPFGVPLYSYGLLLAVSVIAGRMLAIRLAERGGIARQVADRCATWTFVGALVGARLLYVVTNPRSFDSVLDIVACWEGGVVAFGGFLGGLVAAAAFCRAHDVPLLTWADCVAPSLCVGLALTRVGCFLGGCDFGREWNGPWAVRFPAGSPAFVQQRLLGSLPAEATTSLPVHPTQLYESLAGLALLLLVLGVRRRQHVSGQALVAFALGYSVLRYLIEIVRADSDRGTVGPWSTSQFLAIATFVAASALLTVLRCGRVVRSNPAATVQGGFSPCERS
jgi:phosphatidylglycerol---prolipoprotein diacylglyceryl transferase